IRIAFLADVHLRLALPRVPSSRLQSQIASPRPGSSETDARLPASAGTSARSACPLLSPASAAPSADNSPSPSARSVRYTRRSVHSAPRSLPAAAPATSATPDSTPPLFPDSCCARCIRAIARRSSWPTLAPCSPAPFAPAPVPLAPGLPSDPPAPSHYDASLDSTTADRSLPAAPASAHPSDRLSFDSLRSNARCAHAPRSLHAPTRSAVDSPTASASPSPARSGCEASRRTLPAWLSALCFPSVPAALCPLHPTRNTNSTDLPNQTRSSAFARKNSCSAYPLRC